MTGRQDLWIRRTTIGSVTMLALIAGTVSYLHMHALVALHGQPGWVAALYATVGRRDDRRGVDDAACRVAVRQSRRPPAVGVAGDRERCESGGERGGG